MSSRIRNEVAERERLFSALTPVAELVSELNAFQPVVLGGYPSALETLAREQRAGRLHIHPVLINAAGETLSTAKRRLIGTEFGCRVGNYYGSSEAIGLTYECAAQRLHVNSDWYLLEPVDAHNRAVPAGRPSDGVLITNLANRIQPIIRYQMGDRVTMDADPCTCGSPFPSMQVVGRSDDILTFRTPQGGEVQVLPLAIATVAEETPGVASCQLIQRTPSTLTVRLRAEGFGDEQAVWAAMRNRLAAFLSAHGATTVTIERDGKAPALHPRSGKFRQVRLPPMTFQVTTPAFDVNPRLPPMAPRHGRAASTARAAVRGSFTTCDAGACRARRCPRRRRIGRRTRSSTGPRVRRHWSWG